MEEMIYRSAKIYADRDMSNEGLTLLNETSTYGSSKQETLKKIESLFQQAKANADKIRDIMNDINDTFYDLENEEVDYE